jgi:hypothetical protein
MLIGGMALVFAALICVASFLPKPGESAEIKAALEEAAKDQAARETALKEARKAVPKNAPVPPEWEFTKVLDALEGKTGSVPAQLACNYIANSDDIPDKTMDCLRDLLEDDARKQNNPFYFSIDPAKHSKTEILTYLRAFLIGSKTLREVEAGLELGLCQGAVDAYGDPDNSNIVNLCSLFAGRAACEAQSGDQIRAMKTCLTAYRLARLLGEWPHFHSYMNLYYADRQIDFALCRVMDAGPMNEQDQARLLEMLDGRKSTKGLAKALRLSAAHLEVGLECAERGYPKTFEYGFAFTGRGSMERAKRIGTLLNRPPYTVTQEIAQIGNHMAVGVWVNRLCDNGILSYKMHAREALMGDIARIVFALKAYAQKQGAYPASLREISPLPVSGIPVDPLTGSPIVYQGGGNSFVISTPPAQGIWGETYWIARN